MCSDHFNDESYSNKKLRRLKHDAIPTENLVDVFSDEAMLMRSHIGSDRVLNENTSSMIVSDQGMFSLKLWCL